MKNKTLHNIDLIFVLDRSGSMYALEKDTIGGFNSFIEKQKKEEGNTYVTTILFNNNYDILYERKPIQEIKKLTTEEYYVGGTTALLDAVGNAITTLDRKTNNKVLFVIMTDGLENASREYTKEQVKNLINNHDWEFIFLGADIDAYTEANYIGIKKSRASNYDKSKEGLEKVYDSLSQVSHCLRRDIAIEDSWSDDLK